MAQTINTMYAEVFRIAANQTIYFSDDLTGSLTAVTVPAGYYSPWLVNSSSSDGTATNPWCSLQKIRQGLGNYFDFSLDSAGKVKIAYRGSTIGALSFVSSSLLKNMLGFTVTSMSFTSASSHTATYQPYGALFAINSTDTQGWQSSFSQQAFAELPDGRVYGFKDDYLKNVRQSKLRFHPKDYDVTTELSGQNPATPVFPVSKSIWGQPTLLNSGYTPPFTYLHFLRESTGKQVRVAKGTYQENISGSNLKFDKIYFRPEHYDNEAMQEVSIPNYDKLRNIVGVNEILNGEDSRQIWSAPNLTPFDPTQILGLSAWWQADDVTLSGGKITQFNDKSGNGRHATNANATYQVTQSVDAAYNSRTIAVTNGNASQVYTPTSFTVAQPLTIFAIGDGNINDWETFIDSSNANRIIFRKDPSNNMVVFAGSANITLRSLNAKTTPAIAWCEYNGASSKGNVNSLTETALSTPGTNSLLNELLLVGNAGAYPMANGSKFAALLIYNRALTTGEKTQVINYFSSYYGITLT